MVAGERAQEQARELFPDCLAKANQGRRANVVEAIQASAVLENQS
jgi:hypothetical protein